MQCEIGRLACRVRQNWHKLPSALNSVCQRNAAVGTVFIDDGREEGSEERVSLFEFFFAVREQGPVGTVATARREMVDFDEHVLAY